MRLGLGTFSVAAVARELGVTTAAVYRRFPSHKALREECLTRILAEVPPLVEECSWQDALRRAADEWWALCLRYPQLPQVVSGYDEQPSRFIAVPFQTYHRRLTDSGFTQQQVYFTYSLLISALDLVSSMPDDDARHMSRELLRRQATEIIISGVDTVRPGWRAVGSEAVDL